MTEFYINVYRPFRLRSGEVITHGVHRVHSAGMRLLMWVEQFDRTVAMDAYDWHLSLITQSRSDLMSRRAT